MREPDLLSYGRTHQKQRTREALIAAARELIGAGKSPTVEDAATKAGISRTTAYRYFKNQAELLAQAHPETQKTSILPADAPTDVEERVDLVVRYVIARVVEGEHNYRTMLRLSLDPETPREDLLLRQGRAIGWLEEALSPLATKLKPAQLHQLAIAIRSATGIESFVWLVDMAKQSRAAALETMRWSARAMIRTALADGLAIPKPRRR